MVVDGMPGSKNVAGSDYYGVFADFMEDRE